MAHNINENSRVFTVGKSWHGLGEVVETEQTAENAVKLAKMDYNVEMIDVFTGKEGEDRILLNDTKAIRRSDTLNILGITSPKYKIVQNTDAFSFFDSVVGDDQAIYHSAGVLGKGERVWILAKLKGDITICSGDDVEKYLCLTNSHDGKSSLRMYFTPIRVVCQNTLNMSMADAKNGISIRHSGKVSQKVDEARKVLGISINYYNQFENIVKSMESYSMQEKELNLYFDKVLNVKDGEDVSTRKNNQKDELLSLFENGKGQKLGNRHSLWKAYNAVTEYTDHFRTVKNIDKDESNRISSIWFGSGAKLKETAYNEALSLIK